MSIWGWNISGSIHPLFDLARWKERDYAESARWEQQQAYQRYRQGERAEPQPQKKNLWQRAGDWVQQKVIQPVQQAAGTIVSAWKPPQMTGSSKLAAPAKDGLPPWRQWWNGIKTFVQEKIIAPAQQAWNQHVYQPIIQPATRWWKEDVPGWMKETALSLIPIVGDGWGLLRQGLNWAQKKPVDKLDVVLSLAGLVFDLPWPQEGVVGGDVTIAILKGMNAAIPPGPARDVMMQLVKEGLKNPDELARIVKTGEALLKNERLLKALIDHPQALETVMRFGPDAVEVLGRFPADEAISFLQKYGDDGLQRMLKYKDMPTGLADEAFPLGFKNADEFESFGDTIRQGLSEAGYDDVELYITGSSVSGMSYPRPGKPGLPFDSIERGPSDYDIGIVSNELWQKAIELGLPVKSNPPVRIGPLDLSSPETKQILEKLGLFEVVKDMNIATGRDTGFMIYQSAEDFLNNRGPAIAFPGN